MPPYLHLVDNWLQDTRGAKRTDYLETAKANIGSTTHSQVPK